MDDNVAVRFEHISKHYRLGSGRGSLREALTSWPRRLLGQDGGHAASDQEIWALKDVSFEVRKGEVLGIIGPNGAGKTTVLKLIAGVTRPIFGHIEVSGEVSALIELGAGFHPDLPGRENIYLNGAILGLSRREIDALFDKIVAFAGLERFIDTPVKRYSSGMYVRLGFSVAAHSDSDILLVDEVLAVGDVAFRSKCYDWFARKIQEKKSIVFISHNVDVIRRLCDRCLVLNHGNLIFDGETDEAIDQYMKSLTEQTAHKSSVDDYAPDLVISSARLLNESGQEATSTSSGDDIVLEVRYHARTEVADPILGLAIYSALGILAIAVNSQDAGIRLGRLKGKGTIYIRIRSPRLTSGRYTAQVAFHHKESAAVAYDLYRIPQVISIVGARNRRGIVDVKTDWEWDRA